MIKPTIGRVVWFYPHGSSHNLQPHAALIAFVHNDRMVNLGAINEFGEAYSQMSVPLLQDDDAVPAEGFYAQWMPYQVGQAKKHESETPS